MTNPTAPSDDSLKTSQGHPPSQLNPKDDEEYDSDDLLMSKLNFQSIRNEDQLEVGISVQWPGMAAPLHLSTLLEEDDLAPLFAGAQWAGTRVWHAAIAAIEYLTQDNTLSSETRFLELGCGLGVPGLVLHSLYDSHVCLTDQESIMSQLQHNLQTNFPSSSKLTCRALSWSRAGIQDLLAEQQSPYDIVLNCDCIYEPLYGKSWELLVDVLDELLCRNPNTIVITSVERRNADGIDLFVERLKQSPHVASMERVVHQPEICIEIYLSRGVMASASGS